MWQEFLQHGKGFIVEFCRRLRGADRRAFQAEVATDDVAREHRSRRPITICTPRRNSQYNPVERCWSSLERHWNGTLLIDVDTAAMERRD